MNISTTDAVRKFSIEECRRWLHLDDGDFFVSEYRKVGSRYIPKSHYPSSLRGIKKAMPEGWTWERKHEPAPMGSIVDELMVWVARHSKDYPESPVCPQYVYDSGYEILDRFRLAILCRIENKKHTFIKEENMAIRTTKSGTLTHVLCGNKLLGSVAPRNDEFEIRKTGLSSVLHTVGTFSTEQKAIDFLVDRTITFCQGLLDECSPSSNSG